MNSVYDPVQREEEEEAPQQPKPTVNNAFTLHEQGLAVTQANWAARVAVDIRFEFEYRDGYWWCESPSLRNPNAWTAGATRSAALNAFGRSFLGMDEDNAGWLVRYVLGQWYGIEEEPAETSEHWSEWLLHIMDAA